MSAAAQPQNPARTFRQLMEAIETLSPRQLEELVSRALSARSRKEAHADIEHYSGHGCPHCGHGKMQKWGTTPTGIQRQRCAACGRTSSALTGSPLRGLHHFDRFLDMLRDMLSDQPLSCRKLAAKLQVSKDTIWRWRLRALKHLSGGSDQTFAGIIEADETFQRESRKGSREWARHAADPTTHPQPPRLQWHRYKSGRFKMQRGLSRWQLPIITVVDRSGRKLFQRIRDCKHATIDQVLGPLVPADAELCTDAAPAYGSFAASRNIAHFVVRNAPNQRLASPAHHIQNTNSLHSRYEEFIRRFRGPASKYLPLYLAWFLYAQRGTQPRTAFAEIIRA